MKNKSNDSDTTTATNNRSNVTTLKGRLDSNQKPPASDDSCTEAITFSHRFGAEPPTTPTQLSDCINPAMERATAIAELMEVAFERNMDNEIHNLWRAAQAIRFEIMDAQTMLEVYIDAARTTPKQSDVEGD